MSEPSSVEKVDIIEGTPWKDAVISVLEPRSPYRPWYAAGSTEPGDAVIAVLDTDPQSVLAAVGVIGASGDPHDSIAAIDRSKINGLLELGTLNMLADFMVFPRRETTVFHRESLDRVITTIGRYNPSSVDALFGHTSLAAGRVLLDSAGKCTGCRRPIDLTGEDAREHVHIHTAARSKVTELDDPDWPAVLCDSCRDAMHDNGFTSFLDLKFSLHPRCPACSAQRSKSAIYGFLVGWRHVPWASRMGCSIEEPRLEWVCGTCCHGW
jgi:hypothetical protein